MAWLHLFFLITSFLIKNSTGNITPLHLEIRRQVKEDARCNGMNSTTIIMVPTTNSTFDLAMIQRHGIHSRMDAHDSHCLASKWITICLDKACTDRCRDAHVSHCTVYYPLDVHTDHLSAVHSTSGQDIETESADPLFFKSGQPGSPEWRMISSLKWEFIGIAIKMGAQTVLHLDADILVLSNPFSELLHYHGQIQVLHLSETKDIAESGSTSQTTNAKLLQTPANLAKLKAHSCTDAPVHSGLLIVSTSTRNYKYRLVQLINRMLDPRHQKRIVEGSELEQVVLAEAMQELDVSHCALPKESFAGHCPHAHNDKVDVKHLVTYHAHCASTIMEKFKLMKQVLRALSKRSSSKKLNVEDIFLLNE